MKKILRWLFYKTCSILPVLRPIVGTMGYQAPVRLQHILWQKIFRINSSVPWPVHFSSIVSGVANIKIGVDTNPGFMPGCYIQGAGQIEVGDYTQISANVGIISANHDLYDSRKHIYSHVKIGRHCWLGMNSTILPGVTLGDHVIVGAGSVVTKSFPEGYCVIAGNPARKVKDLDKAKVVEHSHASEYIGFRPVTKSNRV